METELWHCEYETKRTAHGCTVKAVTLLRHRDKPSRLISQGELCDDRLTKALEVGGLKVHDRRGAA
jgi:hypothetical protein